MNVLKFKLGHPLVVGVVALIVLATIAGCGSSSTEGIVASAAPAATPEACLLYTSDAADDLTV